MSDSLLTVDDAAEYLRLSKSTVYRKAETGELPHIKKSFGLRFIKSELAEYLDRDSIKVPLAPSLPHTLAPSVDKNGYYNKEVLIARMAKSSKSKTRYNFGYGAIYQRKTKGGKIRWYLDYRDGSGKRIQKVTPLATTREEAGIALREEVANTFNKEYRVKIRKGKINFSEFSNIYLKDYAKVAKRSWETDEYRLKKIKEFFKGVELQDITPLMVQKYRAYRLKDGVGKSTVNREVTLLKKMLNLAIEEGYVERNPAKGIKMFSEMDMVRDRVLSEKEEFRLFLELAAHVKPFAFTSLHTGMRKGELFKLKWHNVDFEKRFIKIEMTKSKKARFIPINSELYDVLKELEAKKGDNQQVFPFKNIQTAWENARKRAGIEDLIFHDLRRTFGTRLLEAGVDIVTISKLYGHSSVLVTQRYLHPKDTLSKEAVESLVKKPDNSKSLLHICDMKKENQVEKPVSYSICMN